ncbi:MAG TPA: autotransporter outer membrane beta-barrel domain-containing protein [Candidatus Omnitrophota bacterium]|nr:autotransporter outer membrane beta-barrel domain-containing protein [Candidatus Omnitrophota bacterium]
MKKIFFVTLTLWMTIVVSASAAPVVFFDDIPAGRNTFDTNISAVGGTQTNDALSGLASDANSWSRTGYTITSTNGASRTVDTTYLATPQPGSIPGGDAIQMTADGTTTSGLTFTFSSPINGFGIDFGDWGTCCHPSTIYICFDGGAPIAIGTANATTDNPGFATYGVFENFIGSIDDSGTFSVVTLYGTGTGDVLYAGGVIRYAIVPIGSISSPSSSPSYPTTVSTRPVSPLANYLDEYDGSGTLQTVATTLDGYSESEVEEALKHIFPVDSVSSSRASMANIQNVNSLVHDKIGTVLGGMDTGSNFNQVFNPHADPYGLSSTGGAFESFMQAFSNINYKQFEKGERGLWIQGMFGGSQGERTDYSNGYNTEKYGVLAGYEFAVDSNHLLGVYANSLYSEIDLTQNAGTTEIKDYIFGVYGQKIMDAYKLSATIGGGIARYDAIRHVVVGSVSGSPEAEYDGNHFSSTFSISRLFEHKNVQLEPFLQTGYLYNKTDGYTESNGGSFNMQVDGNSFAQMNIKAGMAFKKDFQANAKTVSIKVRPFINHIFEVEDSDDINVRFIGASTQTTIKGRDSSVTERGANFELSCPISPMFGLKGFIDYSSDKYEERYVGFLELNAKF